MRLVTRVGLLATAAFVAACSTPPPIAQKPLPPERQIPVGALKALTEWFPDLRVVANSSGPLQPGDVNDIAVVLTRGEGSGDYVLAVLEPAGHDEYRVATASQPINPGCQQCSVGVDVARHGLFVHVIRAVGPDFENFTYQFAYADVTRALRMVGVTAYIPSQPDDPIPHSFSASVDMTTGQRTDVVEDAPNDELVHRERQTSVPVRAPITFDAFSFAADALDVETRRLPPVPFDPAAMLPPVAAEALRERFPQMTVQSQASGSLRGDGSRDIVAVLAPADRPARTGAASDALVAVLLAQPDGSMKLADVSGTLAHDCPTCDVQVQIARRTLIVQTTAVDSAGSQSVDYQFAFRPRELPLRLVGVRTETAIRSANGDDRRYVNSANLLTGDRIDVVDGIVRGRKSRSEQKTRLPIRPPITLAAFAFDTNTLVEETRQDIPREPKAE
ncbi:MAG: hypothetical protein ABJD97_19385 [Betaproteobacteria bacterium]